MPLPNDSRLKRYNDLRDMIGDKDNPTPIVALRGLLPDSDVTLYAKLEWMNPFGSVKDRAAKWMLESLELSGRLAGNAIVEPTSGNTGIALSAISALMGKRMVVTVPWDISAEKDVLLRMLGAEVRRTPRPSSAQSRHPMDVAIDMAEELVAGGGWVMPNQYDNPDNVRSHYESTGPEIWDQTEGTVRYFFAGMGTSGTLVGVGRYLKEQDPSVRVIAVEPVPGHHISGLKNLEETSVPGVLDRSVIDEVVSVDDQATEDMLRRLYAEEALIAGPSAAAILAGAVRYLKGRSGVAVAIAPDSGQKAIGYLTRLLPDAESGEGR
jgi:cysteine synthase